MCALQLDIRSDINLLQLVLYHLKPSPSTSSYTFPTLHFHHYKLHRSSLYEVLENGMPLLKKKLGGISENYFCNTSDYITNVCPREMRLSRERKFHRPFCDLGTFVPATATSLRPLRCYRLSVRSAPLQ